MLGADLTRLFVAVSLVAFASWTDWRWRRAPNVLWLVMAGAGLVILAIEAALDWGRFLSLWPYLVAAPLFAAAMYGAWWVGLIAGGADAKALMALAILVPFPLALAEGVPGFESALPGSFVILADTLVAFLAIPLALFVGNAVRGAFHFPAMLLGYRKSVSKLEEGHAWPMQRVEEGKVKMRLFASRAPEDVPEQKEALAKLGIERVWVTPKIPFMIPLLLGIALAFTLGDLLFAIMSRLIG